MKQVVRKSMGWRIPIEGTFLYLVGLGAFLLPIRSAFGCAVCGVPLDRTSDVFVASTVFLSLIPLIAMGGLVGYLWHQASRRAMTDSLERAESMPNEQPG